MMASSPRAVFTRQRNITTRVYVAISSIILLYLSISVEASIHSVQERFTSRVGGTVNIPFEYCDKPSSSCTHHRFNLSAPNPTCTVDRYGHCEVARAPDNDPFREDMGMGCELCVLVIHGVTQKDAGRYSMCQTSGACTSSFWRYISTLEVEEPLTPTNSTFTTVSTKPTTDLKKTTKPEDAPTNVSEINTLTGTDAQPGNTARSSTSSAVGIPITIVFLVILFIVGAVYFWKRRNRRQNTTLSPASPYADTTTVTITDEVTRLRAESESDT
ncbi:uncharacterized protein LOC100891469 [Strongylocentrotus purpuratus]|uniref:Uncharacterized protein n=1 Tax=Strongylocentrotus purpuratus TaxID=7668 RepID=A0A7M7P0F3_STRPU|nr:uncharacterized protein LOC100891469 [Strongylocentrotus purpuratus]